LKDGEENGGKNRKHLMSEPKGAIPRLIIFIFGLILGFWLLIPSQINIGIMILRAFQLGLQSIPNSEMANQMIEQYIFWLQILGVMLIIADAIGIYVQFRRKEYF